MIEIKNLYGGYQGVPIVKNINTRFMAGQLSVVIGPNGCGKSTLLRMAAGLMPTQQGEVLLQGENVHNIPPKLLAQRVAYLAQSRTTHAILVKNLVLHGRFPYLGYPRRYGKEDMAVARQALARLGIEHLAEKSMDTLSGGERQKAYIAMMLAQGGEVVFMDEPTTYLDISHQLELVRIARQLQQMGKTLVLILHDLNLAMRCADRIFVMDKGEICIEGAPGEVFESGMLQKIFRVEAGSYQTEDAGRQYYFT